MPYLDEARNKDVRHRLLVSSPILLTVLLDASLIVTHGAMDEQDEEVDGVEVGDGRGESSCEAPGKAHEPVPSVVDLPGHAPPTGNHELPSHLGVQRADVGHRGVRRIATELVLLAVRATEDDVAENLDTKHDEPENLGDVLGRVLYEELGLQTVRERDPGEVAKRKHEPKPIRGNVHGGQNGLLAIQSVPHIQALKQIDQDHRRRHHSQSLVLSARAPDVDNHPSDQTRTQFAELLPIKIAFARVELTTDPPVVHATRSVSSDSQQRSLGERLDVQVNRESRAEPDGGLGEVEVIIVNLLQREASESHQLSLVRVHGVGVEHHKERNPEGQMPVNVILEALPIRKQGSFGDVPGKNALQDHLEQEPHDDPAKAFL